MSETPRQRAPLQAAALELSVREPRRRALVIVNPHATTVSDSLRKLVVHALTARYEVDAIDTRAKGHATEISRQGAWEGYDVVIGFGGDGTVNEIVNGLAGSPTPLTCLPGGRTNVYCRLLGVPADIVDATEHLLAIADDWRPRQVDLGMVNGRYFAFTSGVGLDASVVARVDAQPHLKARFGANYFVYSGLRTFTSTYLRGPPRMILTAGGHAVSGVTAIIQNAEYYTYRGDAPVEIAAGVTLETGTLAGVVLDRASLLDMPSLLLRVLVDRLAVARHPRLRVLAPCTALDVTTADTRLLPLHVDGDYIGDVDHAHYDVHPRALTVVA